MNSQQSLRIACALMVAMTLAMTGCYSVSVEWPFYSLKRGMSLTEVTKTTGSPDGVVGEVTTAAGQRVVVWEYDRKSDAIVPVQHEIFWVYMVDGKFFKYAPKGNWDTEGSKIYRTDFSLPAPE